MFKLLFGCCFDQRQPDLPTYPPTHSPLANWTAVSGAPDDDDDAEEDSEAGIGKEGLEPGTGQSPLIIIMPMPPAGQSLLYVHVLPVDDNRHPTRDWLTSFVSQ